ncbi:leucine rich repeats (2 copies) domain-containing protein [Ditylenchus destructor]|nr:leucine rich repeats (2 copies) domain-containing protein [Ditylenchus destructor]
MSTSLGAASHIASTVNNLKSRYYKYLETLCQANNVDIGNLKTSGVNHETLELFFGKFTFWFTVTKFLIFGGLPVLIGLKYFDRLRVLRLFGQEIASLKPLNEVSGTLEELWVCEGALQQLHLYDCKIENGDPIGKLTALDTLDISGNCLTSFSFINNLQFLSPLLPLTSCSIMRSLNIVAGMFARTALMCHDPQFSWIAFHFPYIERLNGDPVNDKFGTIYTVAAEMKMLEDFQKLLVSEREHKSHIDKISKNFDRIDERLKCLVMSLAKAVQTVAKKEGRRDLVVGIHEQTQTNLAQLKKIKKNCLNFEHALHRFRHYYVPSWQLESGRNCPRVLEERELKAVEQHLRWHCSRKDEFHLRLKYAFTFLTNVSHFETTNVNDLFMAVSNETIQFSGSDLRSFVNICDRRNSWKSKTTMDAVDIFQDLASMGRSLDECYGSLFIPLFKYTDATRKPVGGNTSRNTSRQNLNKVTNNSAADIDNKENDPNDTNGGDKTYKVPLSEVTLAMVCMVEVYYRSQIGFDDFRNVNDFEDKIAEQLRKLKELGIDVKMEKHLAGNASNISHNNQNDESVSNRVETEFDIKQPRKSSHKVEELLNSDLESARWRLLPPFSVNRVLSLRNPLELTIAFTQCNKFLDKTDFQSNVTCLDLSDMKIIKLDGIEQMPNLCCLNIAHNKIALLKKLHALHNLTLLDASSNGISKIEGLPQLLMELNLARNHLTCLGFCSNLQLLTKLNISGNRLKTLKGLESSKQLEILLAGENQVRDRSEIDIFANFSKLKVLDLCGCPISESETFRNRMLLLCPSLLSLNHEKIPMEERKTMQRKQGKVLTLDLIEKQFPRLSKEENLSLAGFEFRMIALDRSAIAKLNHVTSVDLSNNSLEHIYELVELVNIVELNLSRNSVISLSANVASAADPNVQILPKLKILDLSNNNLNNQSILRVGLAQLPQLRSLNLSGNMLSRFDASFFNLTTVEQLDVSNNEIKSIKKQSMNTIKELNLAGNKLRDIEGLVTPALIKLDLSNNRIATCAAIKSISSMTELKELWCLGNQVTDRRVYADFIGSQTSKLEKLDGESITRALIPELKRRASIIAVTVQKGEPTIPPSANTPAVSTKKSFGTGINIELFPQQQYNSWGHISPQNLICEEGPSPEQTFLSLNTYNSGSLSTASSPSNVQPRVRKLSIPNNRHRSLSPMVTTLWHSNAHDSVKNSPSMSFGVSGIR